MTLRQFTIFTICLTFLISCRTIDHLLIWQRTRKINLEQSIKDRVLVFDMNKYKSFKLYFSLDNVAKQAEKTIDKNTETRTLFEFINRVPATTDTIVIKSIRIADTLFFKNDSGVITDTIISYKPDPSVDKNIVQLTLAMEEISYYLLKDGKAMVFDKTNGKYLDYLELTNFNNKYGGGTIISTKTERIIEKRRWIK